MHSAADGDKCDVSVWEERGSEKRESEREKMREREKINKGG